MWPPHRTPAFLPWLYPSLTWKIPTEKRELYLTFDDGPVFGPTEFVLDTLKQYSIQATFFCIGDNVLKHPEVFRQILQAGHAVGNHTFNHISGWKFPAEEYVKNVELCNDEIAKHLEGNAPLFRPPYGRITRKQTRSLHEYSIVMWDVLSFDFLKDFAPEKCLQGTIRASRPGSIVVFHDSLKAEKKLTYALPRYVEHFLEKGYTFRKL
jgi:peptidoglycan/xylan/chitin deacetylase (PgdA/CDA1 family)